MSLLQKIWQRSRREATYFSGNARHALGMDTTFYSNARGSRIILYHNVCKTNPHKFNTLFIPVERFEEHLQFYKKHFNVISLTDYYAGKFSNDKYNICLTFDDGLANNYHYMLPLLNKYQIPATFFITAIRDAGFDILWNDFLSIAGKYGPVKLIYKNYACHKNRNFKYVTQTGKLLADEFRKTGFDEKAELMNYLETMVDFKANRQDDDYWLQTTSDQIRALSASPLVTIGAHGYYHNDLAGISLADACEEMRNCKTYLENITGKAVTGIAFPYGSYNADVLSAAKAAGYSQLLATDYLNPQDGTDLSMRERFTVNPFISTANQMNAIIRGHYA
ncbi:polysaccharide deacetylase family protein [Mucilaginibacter celer]|uniref:Polysaccharide deacetylase family protein n=1 Tax=Mucilaginibacter celer TaxID=2305508 RepID=A0A494VX12_9SPHI|nr:polysaccharide deacetylase family protein [Mucilaginibacter celer]AYL96013.1 polysaccharide deacetylase family protein [Mucilaginibacter celer]